MKIYLAGSENFCKYGGGGYLNLYLAGDILYNNMKYREGQQDTMNVYLAGTESRPFVHDIQERDYYILETFFSINAKKQRNH